MTVFYHTSASGTDISGSVKPRPDEKTVAKKSASESVRSEWKEPLYIDAILVGDTMVYHRVDVSLSFTQ